MADHIVDANKMVSDREAFEAWAMQFNPQLLIKFGDKPTLHCQYAMYGWQAATQHQQSRIAELEDAARINRENYEFQRNKADKATATVYQFHYAMKDAGWHPGRTDDNLCDIIRAKGKALAELEAEVQALRKDAEWLPIETAPKDGTNVLCWSAEFGARESRSITYTPGSPGHAEGKTDRWWEWLEPKKNWAFNWSPTHWMPLPPPPGIVGKEGGKSDAAIESERGGA